MADGDSKARTLAGLMLKSRRPRPGASEPQSAPTIHTETSTREQMSLLFAAAAPPQTSTTRTPRGKASPRIWNVRALVADVRESLEAGYDEVWVEGEVSNCRPAASGHVYFTLKDGDAQLSLVMFRRQAQMLRFAPKDGMQVLARGRVSLYESRGQLQLIAETLEPLGAGSLQFAFEQLKAKLLAEGLFEAARKQPLPAFPRCIGVITSPGGAVVHDIIRVVSRRHAALDLLIYPATMQGVDCAATVAAGVRWFNRAAAESRTTGACVDLILIARGGGSYEDLAGFNDEALARAIAASELPVVSAVGHETDFTIADFVADLRAPTPSAAAEMITAAQHRIEERMASLTNRVQRATRYQLMLARQRFTELSAAQILPRVRDGIDRREQRLDELRRRLAEAVERRITSLAKRVAAREQLLRRSDPQVKLLAARHRFELARRRLHPAMLARIAPAASRLEHGAGRLRALSPVAVLERGYALVYSADGRLLRDAKDAEAGETIRARLSRGSLAARVLGESGE